MMSSTYESQKLLAPTAYEPKNANAAMSSGGQTKSLRFMSLSDAQETVIIASTAARYGTLESQPASTMPRLPALFKIDGSQSTKPYTPMLQQKYCTHSQMTFAERNASP